MPILPVAIALVAILAGGALFMSGYSLGREVGVAARDTGLRGRGLPAVLGCLPLDRRALRRWRGGPQRPRAGRHQGHDRRPRRSVLLVPHVGGVPRQPAGRQRPVRGDRRRDRVRGVGRDAGLLDPGPGLPPRDRLPDRRVSGQGGRAPAGRPRARDRRRPARRPDRRRRPGQDPRAQGHHGDPDHPARR